MHNITNFFYVVNNRLKTFSRSINQIDYIHCAGYAKISSRSREKNDIKREELLVLNAMYRYILEMHERSYCLFFYMLEKIDGKSFLSPILRKLT